MGYKTEQEEFWAGEFGTDYIQRNTGPELLASNLGFFCKALARAARPASCIEFGANVGMNLRALKLLYPSLEQHAIEIYGAVMVIFFVISFPLTRLAAYLEKRLT